MSSRLVPLFRGLLAWIAAALLRLLGASWRIEEVGDNPLRDPVRAALPHLAALYHCDILLAAYHFRDRGFSVSVSRSRDGDLVSALLSRLGYSEPARGSSSRGAAASLLGLAHRLRAGVTVAMVTDGPRGPACIPKIGVAALARVSGVVITPVRFEARPTYRFSSWDRTLLPWPFARVRVHYGTPIEVAPGEQNEAAVCAELARRMQLAR